MGNFAKVPKDVVWIIVSYLVHDTFRTKRTSQVLSLLSGGGANHYRGQTGGLLSGLALVSTTFHRAIKPHCFKYTSGWLLRTNAFIMM